MLDWVKEKILILVKTYPHPSATYGELVCVAGITEQGEWRRLYPIPFRDLPTLRQFKKYSWVNVDVARRTQDHRPESYQPNVESVEIAGWLDTDYEWRRRRGFVEELKVSTFDELKQDQSCRGVSLGVVMSSQVIDIEVKEVESEWSEQAVAKLNQLKLGTSVARELKKIPFEFRYVFRCKDDSGPRKALITDWELGMRYLNASKRLNPRDAAEEVKEFYLNLTDESKYDTRLFMGTTLPFNTWVVIGLFYPPKTKRPETTQIGLL